MSNKKQKDFEELSEEQVNLESQQEESRQEPSCREDVADEQPAEDAPQTPEQKIAELEARIAELEDKNLRMLAEFDNYRRRTNKEKLELTETAGERIFTDMLPLVDDFERAIKSQKSKVESQKPERLRCHKLVESQKSKDESQESMDKAFKEGVQLIYQKFLNFLDKNGVHAIETEGADFNTDEHEAVTTFAAGEDKKGKVIDCTQRGYKLGDKVIRFAKVVVGE